MTRIDLLVLKRLGSRIVLTIVVFYGLIALVESLDTYRYHHLAESRGTGAAILAIVIAAAHWSIEGLPLTVLLGTIIGLTDLNQRRELTVIKASGLSIWRVLRAPVAAVLLVSFAVCILAEPVTTRLNRSLNYATRLGVSGAITSSGQFWLEQGPPGQRYVIAAGRASESNARLDDVTVYFLDDPVGKRLIGPSARLTPEGWLLPKAQLIVAGQPNVSQANVSLPTELTFAEFRLKVRSPLDFTFFELLGALISGLNDPRVQAAVLTRFLELLTMPFLLVGSLFIGFAFSAGYRRADGYGVAVLYGILLGFVVWVITELANRAGSAGALDPALAAVGPAVVAIVIGASVLLFREDGRV